MKVLHVVGFCVDKTLKLEFKWRRYEIRTHWSKCKRETEKEYSWNILKSAPLDIQECECIFGFWRDRKYFRVACEKGFMLVSTVHAYGVE